MKRVCLLSTLDQIEDQMSSLLVQLKGFVCSVKGTYVCCPQCCYIRPNLQIYTSENNGPFVLKKEDLTKDLRDEAEIVYTVE